MGQGAGSDTVMKKNTDDDPKTAFGGETGKVPPAEPPEPSSAKLPQRKRRANRLREWKASKVGSAVIAGAAILGFVIATANGLYTVFDNVQRHSKIPEVRVRSAVVRPEFKNVRASAFLGLYETGPITNAAPGFWNRDPPSVWEVPFFTCDLVLVNRTDTPLSIIDCELNIRFDGDKRTYSSYAYITSNATDDVRPGGPVLYLKEREARREQIEFYFLPLPGGFPIDPHSTEDSGGEFWVACVSDQGQVMSTPIEKFDWDTIAFSP
jgi:hypothetical protein